MSRRLARKTALQLLFQVDFGNVNLELAMDSLLDYAPLAPVDQGYARKLAQGVLNHLAELDKAISYFAKGWSLQRIGGVDRNILRMCIFEIRYVEDVPHKVSVNEAVELAKEFGDEKSPKFINGILGAVLDYLEEDEKSD